MEAFSLIELNEHVRRVIALNFQEPVWVRCEISQVKVSRGHFYLDLVEKIPEQDEVLAQMPAVIWAKTAWTLQRKFRDLFDQVIQDGMEVKLKARLDFHERYGLKLMIDDIDPSFTLGNIEARRREIIETLKAEGRIGLNARVPVPMVLQRIAVLSAEQAAGYHDFRQHILQNAWQLRFSIDLYNVAVQGAQVENQVVSALESIRRVSHHYDCVVLIRGGGARLDLAAFDNLKIGRAISDFPLPVFTGIGHEIDHTVADAVSHTSLKTPTAVADFLIETNVHYISEVERLYESIGNIVDQRLNAYRTEIKHMAMMLRRAPGEALLRHRLQLQQHIPALLQSARQVLRSHSERLKHTGQLLQALDPELLLQRGFSVTMHQGKRLLRSSQVGLGDEIETYLHEGRIKSIISSHE